AATASSSLPSRGGYETGWNGVRDLIRRAEREHDHQLIVERDLRGIARPKGAVDVRAQGRVAGGALVAEAILREIDAPHVEELPQHRLEGRIRGLDVDHAARVVRVQG